MKWVTRVRICRSAPALAGALMPLSANAQAFNNLCNVYNTYFSANSKLISFALMIWVIGALVFWFGQVGGDRQPKVAFLLASVPITAGVVMMFPQVLGTMGVATC